jgi:hypothetical protein
MDYTVEQISSAVNVLINSKENLELIQKAISSFNNWKIGDYIDPLFYTYDLEFTIPSKLQFDYQLAKLIDADTGFCTNSKLYMNFENFIGVDNFFTRVNQCLNLIDVELMIVSHSDSPIEILSQKFKSLSELKKTINESNFCLIAQ